MGRLYHRKPQFYCVKVGYKGVSITRKCYADICQSLFNGVATRIIMRICDVYKFSCITPDQDSSFYTKASLLFKTSSHISENLSIVYVAGCSLKCDQAFNFVSTQNAHQRLTLRKLAHAIYTAKTQSGWTFGFHFCQKMNFKWGIFRWHFCYPRHLVGAKNAEIFIFFSGCQKFYHIYAPRA